MKHNKPVIVMEPVKGGSLANLPDGGKKALDDMRAKSGKNFSDASYAVRFAASFDQIFMVLSGMSNLEQMEDIPIPEVFSCYNAKLKFHSWNQTMHYNDVVTKGHGKASDCIGCGKCEQICPQKLPIRNLLKDATKELEPNLFKKVSDLIKSNS